MKKEGDEERMVICFP